MNHGDQNIDHLTFRDKDEDTEYRQWSVSFLKAKIASWLLKKVIIYIRVYQ